MPDFGCPPRCRACRQGSGQTTKQSSQSYSATASLTVIRPLYSLQSGQECGAISNTLSQNTQTNIITYPLLDYASRPEQTKRYCYANYYCQGYCYEAIHYTVIFHFHPLFLRLVQQYRQTFITKLRHVGVLLPFCYKGTQGVVCSLKIDVRMSISTYHQSLQNIQIFVNLKIFSDFQISTVSDVNFCSKPNSYSSIQRNKPYG